MSSSLSTVLISLGSLIFALLFNNHEPPTGLAPVTDFGDDPYSLLADASAAARSCIQDVADAIASANVTLVIEVGLKGKLIAKEINRRCRNGTYDSDDAIRLHNWGGNFNYSTQNVQYPRTTAQVQHIVRNAKKLRVLGQRHSFTKIADSPDTLLSTLGMNSILGFNSTIPSVTVQAGISYTDLCPFLQSLGYGLENLAALAEISIGGAITTGTHGSGPTHQNLPSQVLSMQMVLANGTVATFKRADPAWNGLAVGLGAFGVMTQLELQLLPTFNTTTSVFLNMPMTNLYANFDAIMSMGYSVQIFTALSNPTVMDQVWVTVKSDSNTVNPVGNLTQLFGGIMAPVQVSPIAILPATYLIQQGVNHPWYQGLTDYGFGMSGMDGDEIQTEYIVPYANAIPAIQAVSNLSAIIAPILYVWFSRTIKSDDFWLSQCYGGDLHVSLHFTWQPNMTAVLEVLPQIDQVLEPFDARPHWGKLFTMKPSQYFKLFPKLDNFKKLAKEMDPNGKFRNEFLEKNVFIEGY